MDLTVYLLPGPHLLPRLHERLIPYFELASSSAVDETSAAAQPTFPTRVKRKIVETYRTLVNKFPLQERLCTALADADTVQILYPDNLTADDARRSFEHFLRFQLSKHKFWIIVDSALAGLGAVLMPLPGPNIFFFYPAVRVYSHYRARLGASQAAQRAIRYIPNARLGEFCRQIHGKPRRKIVPLVDSLAADLQLSGLPEFFQKDILHKTPPEQAGT